MTLMKDGLLSKPQLTDCRVLRHAVVLLILTHYGATSQPIVAMVGDDAILPCHLEPAADATDLMVEWARPELKPRFVHLMRDSVELQQETNPLYIGRTSLSPNKLKCGDVSLKLSKVKLSDGGNYRCFVPKAATESVVELIVGSVSSPYVHISKVSNGVMLDCESAGWYPEPEVLWLDAEGKLLSAGPPETVRGPDDLYTVSSRVTVEKRHSNSFTCRVQQKNTNLSRDAHIHLLDDLFMIPSSSALRITICSMVCFTFVVSVVFVGWKWGRSDSKTTNSSVEHQFLMEGEGHAEKLMTKSEKMAYLGRTHVKLNEDLLKTEEELQHVQQVISTLMEKKKKDLKNQREKLIALQQEDKTQISENEKKLKTTQKINKDKKKKREKTKQDLEMRQKEHQELIQNTEKLLDTTEEMILKMSEWKAKLERDMQQIKKNLKETETRRKLLQQQEREEENKTSNEEHLEKSRSSIPLVIATCDHSAVHVTEETVTHDVS